jgi:hypothetical protein
MKNAFIAVIALAAHAPFVAAQPAAARHDPADPAAPAPAFQYESAFKDYRGYRETPLAPWREVNDEVGRVGGHVGIFRAKRDASGAAPQGAPPSRPSSPALSGSKPGTGHR